MKSDFIRVTVADGEYIYVNAYRVNAVETEGDGVTTIHMNLKGQRAYCTESAEEVVALIDNAVNGESLGPVVVPHFPGME